MDLDGMEEVESDVRQAIFRCRQNETYNRFFFIISNYRELEPNVEYGYEVRRPIWDIRIKKTAKHLFVAIYTERPFGDIFYVVTFSEVKHSKELQLMKQSEDGCCRYTSELPLLEFVEKPDNELLVESNLLEFQFIWGTRKTRIQPYLCANRHYALKCEEGLVKDMVKAKTESQFNNFAINNLDGRLVIRVDKPILAARCRIFDAFPKYKYANQLELEVRKAKKGMDLLRTYMYTGEIIGSRRNLLRVYHLAKHLMIRDMMVMIADKLLELIENDSNYESRC